MMIYLILALSLLNPIPADSVKVQSQEKTSDSHGAELLNQMADRYSAASGIQWTMQSLVYSPSFDETETTMVEFTYNPPDTFYFKGSQEEILGIADTLWVMSKRHKQIQKKLTEAYVMPADLIIYWQDRYDVDTYTVGKKNNRFDLKGFEGVQPASMKLTTGKDNSIKKIFYKDSSGDDVTFVIKSEKLKRSGMLNLFHINPPKGYKIIDLTE